MNWCWWKQLVVRHFEKLLLLWTGHFAVTLAVVLAFRGLDEKYVFAVLVIGTNAFSSLTAILNQAITQKRQTDEVREERTTSKGEKVTRTHSTEVTDGAPPIPTGPLPVEVVNPASNPVPTEEAGKEKKT